MPVLVLVLAGVSTLGHLRHIELGWTVVPVGMVALLLAWLLPLPKRERVYALAWTGPATLWTLTSWIAGIDNRAVLLALVVLGPLAIMTWLRLQHPRARIEVADGSILPWRWNAWRWRREARSVLGPVVERWDEAARLAKVPGATLVHALADPEEGYEVLVSLPRGRVFADLDVPRLQSALREFPFEVATPSSMRQWEVLLRMPHDAEEGIEGADAGPQIAPADERTERIEMLRAVVLTLGAEVVSEAELGRRARPDAPILRDWVNRNLPGLARELGLRKVKGGWQRLAVEEDAS